LSVAPSIQRFISELQRRKVLRVASAYVVAGWIVLQVSATLENTLNLPASFDTVVFGILAGALPIVLGLTWVYEITPQGIQRTKSDGDGALVMPETTDLLLAGMLVLVGLIAVAQIFVPRDAPTPATVVEAPTKPAPPAAPTVDPKSIAVLPFINMSSDPKNEVFSDGLTEEILNLLAQRRDLKVISRTSSFSFKGQNVPLPEVAKKLGVRHVLEGSVRRSDDGVRITAQLIDVTNDVHLWSKAYDRKIENIFAVQDEIATAIAAAMNLQLDLAAPPRDAPTKSIEAYRLFLEARVLFRERSEAGIAQSIDLYQRATKLDPAFAQAYAGLAASYTSDGSRNAKKFADNAPLARRAAEKAIALDQGSAQAHAVLGSMACDRLQWNEAFERGNRAVALDPSDSTALLWLGLTQYAVGRLEEAARTLEKAARVDPLYTFIDIWRARIAFARRDDVGGAALSEKLLGGGADAAVHGYLHLAAIAKAQGKLDDAEKHFRAAAKIGSVDATFTDAIVGAITSPDGLAAARKVLLDEATRDSAFNPDVIYFLVGDTDGFVDLIARRLRDGDTTRVAHMIGLAWRMPGWAQTAKGRALLKDARIVDYWRKAGAPPQCDGVALEDFVCR
jgi:adenylate cyclase